MKSQSHAVLVVVVVVWMMFVDVTATPRHRRQSLIDPVDGGRTSFLSFEVMLARHNHSVLDAGTTLGRSTDGRNVATALSYTAARAFVIPCAFHTLGYFKAVPARVK